MASKNHSLSVAKYPRSHPHTEGNLRDNYLLTYPPALKPIEDILDTVIMTQKLSDVVVSIVLVAPSGQGKSDALLKRYRNLTGMHYTDTISATGLYRICQQDFKNEKKFLLCPDFNVVLSRKSSTLTLLLGTMIGLMSDGSVRVDDGSPLRPEFPHKPVGLITAMTPGEFETQSRLMHRTGLIRRMIPIFYDYSPVTEIEIMKFRSQNGHSLQFHPKTDAEFFSEMVKLKWMNGVKDNLIMLAQAFSTSLQFMPAWKDHKRIVIQGDKVSPVPMRDILEKLCEARARLTGKTVIDFEVYNFVQGFVKFTTYGQVTLL